MLPKVNWNDEEQVAAVQKTIKTELQTIVGKHLQTTWKEITQAVAAECEQILAAEAKGAGNSIPQVQLADILAKRVPEASIAAIRKRGAVVIRQVYPRAQVEQWYADLVKYVEDNKYYEQDIDPNLDKYFSGLASKKPQILNIYWSIAQMELRQHENMAKAKQFLNHLWKYENNGQRYFDPDRECIYADRFRMRVSGDTTLGLSPHIDGGSVERWLDDANRKIYTPIFEGKWDQYDPFDGAYRNEVENIPSPAVCRAFRTYQGWVALTQQGPGDGTLRLVPAVKASTAYLLLRPFAEDVAAEVFTGAEPARAQAITTEHHQALLDCMVSIPLMQPGDTVWWHHDLIHAVEDEHKGKQTSSVTYIGSAPLCDRNVKYLALQKQAYLNGDSAPDFAPEHREREYVGRSQLEKLSLLGKRQMGFVAW